MAMVFSSQEKRQRYINSPYPRLVEVTKSEQDDSGTSEAAPEAPHP